VIYKFRTMRGLRGPVTAQGDQRVTPIGRLLRTNVDELPQRWASCVAMTLGRAEARDAGAGPPLPERARPSSPTARLTGPSQVRLGQGRPAVGDAVDLETAHLRDFVPVQAALDLGPRRPVAAATPASCSRRPATCTSRCAEPYAAGGRRLTRWRAEQGQPRRW
jgi:hypothetical protein